MGKDGFMVEQVALCIETHDLATRAESRVNTHHPLLSEWCREQKLAQILGKDVDGLLVCLLLAEGGKLVFYAGLEQALVGIVHRFAHQGGTRAVAVNVAVLESFGRIVVVGRYAHAEYAFVFASPDGKQTVGGTAAERLGKVEVVGKLGSIFRVGFCLDHFGCYDGFPFERSPHLSACLFILADGFGNDVLCSLDGSLHVAHLLADKPLGCHHRLLFALHHENDRQRLESLFACHLCPGAPFRLVGQVDILQFGGVPTVVNALFQFVGKFALRVDSVADGVLSFGHLLHFVVALTDGGYLYFVQSSSALLAIPADKGNGASLFKQLQCVRHPTFRKCQFVGYDGSKCIVFH